MQALVVSNIHTRTPSLMNVPLTIILEMYCLHRVIKQEFVLASDRPKQWLDK